MAKKKWTKREISRRIAALLKSLESDREALFLVEALVDLLAHRNRSD